MLDTEKKENNKFVYEKGDIEVKSSQCDFCKHNNDDNNTCIKFPNGKPEEIKATKKRCEYLDLN